MWTSTACSITRKKTGKAYSKLPLVNLSNHHFLIERAWIWLKQDSTADYQLLIHLFLLYLSLIGQQ